MKVKFIAFLFCFCVNVMLASKLPQDLEPYCPDLLEKCLEEKQDLDIKKLLKMSIDEKRYNELVIIEYLLIDCILSTDKNVKKSQLLLPKGTTFQDLSENQRTALALFLTQWEGEECIKMVSIKNRRLLAGSLNLLAEEKDEVSQAMFRTFRSKIPQKFLEGSEY